MRPEISATGKRLLLKAVKAIQARPDTFDMGFWMRHDGKVQGKAPYCGTVACLAGHILLAAGFKPGNNDHLEPSQIPAKFRARFRHPSMYDSLGGPRYVPNVARRLLGLAPEDTPLFQVDDWPSEYALEYRDPSATPKGRARTLARRVAHWLKTGE